MSNSKWIAKIRIQEILQGRFDDWSFCIATDAIEADYGPDSSFARKLQEIRTACISKVDSLTMTKVRLNLILEDLRRF